MKRIVRSGGLLLLLLLSIVLFISACGLNRPTITIISGSENETLEPLIEKFERQAGVNVEMTYKGSVDIMLALQSGDLPYDAVWPANSLWINLGDEKRMVKHTESIMTSPVVFGIRRSLAEELGFVGRKVEVRDILAAIDAGKLKFMMTSATQSNSGASAYFGFLYALLGNPEVISAEMLDSEELKNDIRRLLGGINRGSGSSGWLKELFLESDYDAMVNYEALIIETNQERVRNGKEPLYLVYPVDGIVIADSPLGFVPHGESATEEAFLELQSFLLSDEVQRELTGLGRRTGFGGLAADLDPRVFKPEWGIDTEMILSPFRMPSGEVIAKALNMYQTVFRKPSFTVYALDYSGSMAEAGEWEMKDAMDLLLNQQKAQQFLIQTGDEDISVVIPFSYEVLDVWAIQGNKQADLDQLSLAVRNSVPDGGTDIYSPVIRGLEIMRDFPELEAYQPAIILMTDGESNNGADFRDLQRAYTATGLDIPVFGIIFGNAVERQLQEITDLTNGRIFDGKHDLIATFRKAKGYN